MSDRLNEGQNHPRITIHDIARETGVSYATVSRVMSNAGPMSEETREIVHYAAEELGYVPDAAAIALRTQKHVGPTMMLVAELANTSIGTVSRVINGAPHKINMLTRERVLRVIEGLNYRPNKISQEWKSRTFKRGSRLDLK